MRLFLFITVFFTSFFSAQSHKGFRWIGRDHSLFSVDLRTGMLTKGTKKNEIIESVIKQMISRVKYCPF